MNFSAVPFPARNEKRVVEEFCFIILVKEALANFRYNLNTSEINFTEQILPQKCINITIEFDSNTFTMNPPQVNVNLLSIMKKDVKAYLTIGI